MPALKSWRLAGEEGRSLSWFKEQGSVVKGRASLRPAGTSRNALGPGYVLLKGFCEHISQMYRFPIVHVCRLEKPAVPATLEWKHKYLQGLLLP